jgi:cardiolipin synthase (CMP-forming)
MRVPLARNRADLNPRIVELRMEVSQSNYCSVPNVHRVRLRIHAHANRINLTTTRFHPQLTLPNLLTGSRFLIAPLLLYLAWVGHTYLYVLLLCLSFFSDLIDGMLARMLSLESALGAALDTWSDFVIYVTLPITAWWLWPALVRQEIAYVLIIVLGFTVPALIGTLKFRAVPSYHTWGAKIAAACVASTMLLMVLVGPVWPFRFAALISLAAALEEIAITLVLTGPRADVRSLWHALFKPSRT